MIRLGCHQIDALSRAFSGQSFAKICSACHPVIEVARRLSLPPSAPSYCCPLIARSPRNTSVFDVVIQIDTARRARPVTTMSLPNAQILRHIKNQRQAWRLPKLCPEKLPSIFPCSSSLETRYLLHRLTQLIIHRTSTNIQAVVSSTRRDLALITYSGTPIVSDG